MARVGVVGCGVVMLGSAALWVRNPFGLLAVLSVGVLLILAGSLLERSLTRWLFVFLATTCCLNALLSLRVLFSRRMVVGGRLVGSSDAHAVADALLLPSWFWASCWLLIAIGLLVLALRVPAPRKTIA
jgi:hypothetical protein